MLEGRWRLRGVIAAIVAVFSLLAFFGFSQAQQSDNWVWIVSWIVLGAVGSVVAIFVFVVLMATFLPDPLPMDEIRLNPGKRGLLTSNEVEITKHSTHFQLYKRYRYYKGDWEFDDESQWNFCDYFWGITVGLPVLWFFRGNLVKDVEPVWFAALFAILTAIGTSWYFWPGTTTEVMVLIAFGVILTAVGIWVIGGPIGDRISNIPEATWDRWMLKGTYFLTPIWLIPIMLCVLVYQAIAGVIRVTRDDVVGPNWRDWMRWFFTTRRGILTPWLPYLLALWAAVWWYWGSDMQLLAAKWLLIATIITAVMGGAIALGIWLYQTGYEKLASYLPKREEKPEPEPEEPKVDKGSSMWQLFWVRFMAQKRKICPIIVLPEDG